MIHLTPYLDESKIRINPASIEHYSRGPCDEYTSVFWPIGSGSDGHWRIKETPEEIDAMLRELERREFAKAAMQGLLANPAILQIDWGRIGEHALECADTTLSALEVKSDE